MTFLWTMMSSCYLLTVWKVREVLLDIDFIQAYLKSRGGHFIVKLNTTWEQSLLPLYYMP